MNEVESDDNDECGEEVVVAGCENEDDKWFD